MPQTDPRLLQRAEMFAGLSPDELADVMGAGIVRRLAAGERVFAQGDPGVTCHSLLEGRVKIVQALPDGSQSVLRFIGPGDMYGTVAALMGQPFPADAVAVTESLEIRWAVPAFRELMRRHPEIGLRSTASAGTRLFDLQNRVSELTSERGEQRIAKALLRPREAARDSDGRDSGMRKVRVSRSGIVACSIISMIQKHRGVRGLTGSSLAVSCFMSGVFAPLSLPPEGLGLRLCLDRAFFSLYAFSERDNAHEPGSFCREIEIVTAVPGLGILSLKTSQMGCAALT